MSNFLYKVCTKHCPKGYVFRDYFSARNFCIVNDLPLCVIQIFKS